VYNAADQQVLFLTSEDPDTLSAMSAATEHEYLEFEEK
jgi:hypothetical protein